jgi:tungstate transport system substrate-binding protein
MDPKRIERRRFLALGAGAATLPAALSCAKAPPPATPKTPAAPTASAPPPAPTVADPKTVRVASVSTAVEGDVLPALAEAFEKASGLRVTIAAVEDPYSLARRGEADLVVSHYGHHETESFVMEGSGEWPRTVFSNQMSLVGPPSDPARVRGLADVGEAIRRIAESKSPFVLVDVDGGRYLAEVAWNAAGRPDRSGWIESAADDGGAHGKGKALRLAADRKAYVFCGLTPFLRTKAKAGLDLESLVVADPLLLRLMVSVVVKGSRIPGVNTAGALALESHVLSPTSQARIRLLEYPGQHVHWVPAGRDNRSAILPKA